jgi:hypothetical protein
MDLKACLRGGLLFVGRGDGDNGELMMRMEHFSFLLASKNQTRQWKIHAVWMLFPSYKPPFTLRISQVAGFEHQLNPMKSTCLLVKSYEIHMFLRNIHRPRLL